MSKYDPLRHFLADRRTKELPLTFHEVEEILGFRLPPSARAHPAWWSNNLGTNVAVRAWREAGWRTSRVDLGREKVVFVKAAPPAAETADQPAPTRPADQMGKLFPRGLHAMARRLIEVRCEQNGIDWETAVAKTLNEAAESYWKGVWTEVNASSSPVSAMSGAEIIRELRDAE